MSHAAFIGCAIGILAAVLYKYGGVLLLLALMHCFTGTCY
jgi:hypothetical protein